MPIIFILLLLSFPKFGSPAREEEMVESWAALLGEELWELGTTVTKSPEIRTSYTKLNARVLPTDGEGILNNILLNLGKLTKQKMDSIKCLIKRAEEDHLNSVKDPEAYENSTYVSSVYSPVIDDEEDEVTEFEREDGIEVDMSYFRDMPLKEDHQFYGARVNTTFSSVLVPIDIFDRGPEVLSSIVWSEGLDATFINNYLSDSEISWQYFCSSEGFLRHFPGLHWQKEDDAYDCRSRLWFLEAATCSKDVLILVDWSGSMNDIKKTLAKVTLHTILDTLSNNDFVNILTFNKTVKEIAPCFPDDVLIQATPENKKIFKAGLGDHDPDDKADMNNAFLRAFKILESAKESRPNNEDECSQVVLLITDGIAENMTDFFNDYYNRTNSSIRVFVFVVGRDASNLDLARLIACQNRGYFAHIKYMEEVRVKVLQYVSILARPMILQRKDRPLSWSHLFVDASGLTEEDPVEQRIMTTVAGPVFDTTVDKEKQTANLLGVIGTDILVKDIKKLALPYKIGANGYAFLLTNNGYLIFHPDLRSEEHGILKENFNSVDLVDVELYDDDNTEIRSFNEEVLRLREAMVSQEEGSIPNMMMKFHYDNMRRVGTETRTYYYAPIKDTPFSLGLVLPYSYGSYWIKAGDEIKKSIQMGIPLTDHFRGNWKVHPDWVYCDYHKTSLWFDSKEEKLRHFLEKMSSTPFWKWKEQFPDSKFNLSSPENCDKEPIPEEDYFCDKDLMQLLVFDAKVTENSFKDSQWSAKNRREEELVTLFGVSVRFVATQSGLTRWQHIPDLPSGSRPFGDNYFLSLEESWYKSAVLFHQIDPDAFVFSVPFHAGLLSDTVVTATYAIFPRDGGNEAPGSVVGLQMLHETLYNRFVAITSKTKCRECNVTCISDSLDCYVIDNNGYIVISEVANDTGRFFGELEGAVMEAMILRNIFRRVPIFDYQGICFKKTLVRSGADILMAPFSMAKQLILWFLSRMLFILVQTNQWLPVYADFNDDYDLQLEKAAIIESVPQKLPPAPPKEEYIDVPEVCEKAGFLYILQPSNKEQDSSAIATNCSRPFFVKRIQKTNLLLVVVNTLYQSCYRRLSAHVEKIVYDNPYSQEPACQKLSLNDLPRGKSSPCFTAHPLEEEMETCGTENVNPSILLISLLIFLFKYII